MYKMFDLILCHVFGDYILQQDFIAQTKGKNWYHLFVHCMLYVLPFRVVYGCDYRLMILLATHFVIDALKARYKKINYVQDQLLHYLVAIFLYVLLKGVKN